MRLKDTYYAPVHITDSYQITRLTFVSLEQTIVQKLLLKMFYSSVLCININILIIFNLQLNCVCSAF